MADKKWWKRWDLESLNTEDLGSNSSLNVRLDDFQDSFYLGSFDFMTPKTSSKSSDTMAFTWYFHQKAESSSQR